MIAKFNFRINGKINAGAKPANTPSQNLTPTPQTPLTPTSSTGSSSFQMGSLEGADRSVYVKDLMKLPRNMNELMFMLQKNLNQSQLNKMFEAQIAARRNFLTQTQAQILAQLNGLSMADAQAAIANQMNGKFVEQLKNLQIAAGQMISLADISALIQTNGKDAITKLILAMANASKQGISDLTQLKETAKLINASIALASTDNPSQTLKTLMLLYLPWLPLQEGVDFELEIASAEGSDESDSILIITITTVHFGVLTATLLLENQNSVRVNIECEEDFPKDELLLRIESEEKHYSMQSLVTFDTKKNSAEVKKPEVMTAKVNMSHTTEISPYLLLAAHSLIRHTIELDNSAA